MLQRSSCGNGGQLLQGYHGIRGGHGFLETRRIVQVRGFLILALLVQTGQFSQFVLDCSYFLLGSTWQICRRTGTFLGAQIVLPIHGNH